MPDEMDRVITATEDVYRPAWMCVTIEGWSPSSNTALEDAEDYLDDTTDELQSLYIERRSSMRYDWTLRLYRKKP
jgi:hypothetical protein